VTSAPSNSSSMPPINSPIYLSPPTPTN
jgi:hypothetical protein